jgi:hypothetical protein
MFDILIIEDNNDLIDIKEKIFIENLSVNRCNILDLDNTLISIYDLIIVSYKNKNKITIKDLFIDIRNKDKYADIILYTNDINTYLIVDLINIGINGYFNELDKEDLLKYVTKKIKNYYGD